jgi:hypothetical protein
MALRHFKQEREKYLDRVYNDICPVTPIKDLGLAQFRAVMRNCDVKLPADPGNRTFGGLGRDATGYFNDSDLVSILTEATEDIARLSGARGVPVTLKPVEILSMQQARRWGVATLNELREHFGLLPHTTDTSINSDPGMMSCASMEPTDHCRRLIVSSGFVRRC